MPLSDGPDGPEMKLYVCGITPYDSGHLGHAFTFCSFDVLVRWVLESGAGVRHVQNVTDVDDPLFERARQGGVDWAALAAREVDNFNEDMARLGWRPPDFNPRVSTEVPSILDAVRRLAAAGYAYQADALYFEVGRFPSYGALSHRTRRSMLRKLRDEGLLGTVGPGAKRDALDFPLWRPSAPDEPAWDSEFGAGRPGWHIECSAMSMRYLGPQVDVHGGGRDLAFSHHESERAQSESLTGTAPFARAWLHTGMVRFEGAKMSKSLGNLVTVRQCLARVSPAATRLYLVSHHYRSDWSFRWEALERMAGFARHLGSVVEGVAAGAGGDSGSGSAALRRRFTERMDDDLDTPGALLVLREAVRTGDRPAAAWMASILLGTAAF